MKHHCHATGCGKLVAPAKLMCLAHWRLVPEPVQKEIWRTYRVGQEVDKRPSDEYIIAYKAAVAAVERAEGKRVSFEV